ncbi:MAG: pimeloyl-ACP methyl ester carboxylesterase [Minisyncoccia bacterium]
MPHGTPAPNLRQHGYRRTLATVSHTAATLDQTVPFPGAEAPSRQYDIDANGIRIAIHEWGDADAPPMLAVHGGFDFARTYDLFAPRLAAGGWRVVSWDQRGHGDSEHAELYSWDADMRDALAVFDHVGRGGPLPVVGHSKGGALMTQLADAQPFRFTGLVNMDGIPYKRNIPDIAEHERSKMMAKDIASWLDHRRRTSDLQRKPGTIDELAQRRGRMNPRLEVEWLRRLVTTGGFESEDGWRWKIDSSMRFGGFGPWRPEWTLMRLPGLPMPFLGILGSEMEEMGWGTPPKKVLPYMPLQGRCEVLEGVGHFVHVEQPQLVADLVLDFFGGLK